MATNADATIEIEAAHARIRALEADLASARRDLADRDDRLKEYFDEQTAERAVTILKRRYGFVGLLATLIIIVLGWLGSSGALRYVAKQVFAEEGKEFRDQAARARQAANSAETAGLLLTEQTTAWRRKAEASEAELDTLRAKAADVEQDLSALTGDDERIRAELDTRLATLETQLASISETLDGKVRMEVKQAADKANKAQEMFSANGAISVSIVYFAGEGRARQQALGFQHTLARAGYATSVTGSDFKEIGGPREMKSVQVIGATAQDSKPVAELLELGSSSVRVSDKRRKNDVQILIF